MIPPTIPPLIADCNGRPWTGLDGVFSYEYKKKGATGDAFGQLWIDVLVEAAGIEFRTKWD